MLEFGRFGLLGCGLDSTIVLNEKQNSFKDCK